MCATQHASGLDMQRLAGSLQCPASVQTHWHSDPTLAFAVDRRNAGVLTLHSTCELPVGSTCLPSFSCAADLVGTASCAQVTSDAVFLNDRAIANGTAVSSVFTFNLGIVAVHEVGCEVRPLPNNRGCWMLSRRCPFFIGSPCVARLRAVDPRRRCAIVGHQVLRAC